MRILDMRIPFTRAPRAPAVLLVLACASCSRDGAGLPPSPPIPAAADLRFKGVGTRSAVAPQLFSNLVAGQLQVHANRLGTPLTVSPCAPPNSTLPSCSWSFGVFDMPGSGLNTVYYGLGSLAQLTTDLGALQRWAFSIPSRPGEDISSVVTSLEIDAPSGEYATSGIQTGQMREFDLVWGSVSPGALQATAREAGAQGRVITAVAVAAGSVVYLSYGWERDRSTVYEAKVVAARFGTVARDATNLARDGGILGAHDGTSRLFNIFIGEK